MLINSPDGVLSERFRPRLGQVDFFINPVIILELFCVIRSLCLLFTDVCVPIALVHRLYLDFSLRRAKARVEPEEHVSRGQPLPECNFRVSENCAGLVIERAVRSLHRYR